MSPVIEIHTPKATEKLSVLIFKKGGSWIAQCLEHCLAAQGSSPEECERNLTATVFVQAKLDVEAGRKLFSQLPAAPAQYWQEYHKLLDANAYRKRLPIRIPSSCAQPQHSDEVDADVALSF
jgi:hypothetical protein